MDQPTHIGGLSIEALAKAVSQNLEEVLTETISENLVRNTNFVLNVGEAIVKAQENRQNEINAENLKRNLEYWDEVNQAKKDSQQNMLNTEKEKSIRDVEERWDVKIGALEKEYESTKRETDPILNAPGAEENSSTVEYCKAKFKMTKIESKLKLAQDQKNLEVQRIMNYYESQINEIGKAKESNSKAVIIGETPLYRPTREVKVFG